MTQDLLYAQFNPDEGRQYIPREEIIDSVIDILDGKYDNVPPEKLIFCGSLKTVEQQPAHQ